MFRRSPLNNSSVLIQVLASQASERLVAYQEAGYRHCHTDHAVLVKCNCSSLSPLSLVELPLDCHGIAMLQSTRACLHIFESLSDTMFF